LALARADDLADQRPAEAWTALLEGIHSGVHGITVRVGQTDVPTLELVCDLDWPRHNEL